MSQKIGILFALMLATFQGGFAASASPVAQTAPAGSEKAGKACLIKGNISRSGERIYHVPGGRWYDATRIDPRRGEYDLPEAQPDEAGILRA